MIPHVHIFLPLSIVEDDYQIISRRDLHNNGWDFSYGVVPALRNGRDAQIALRKEILEAHPFLDLVVMPATADHPQCATPFVKSEHAGLTVYPFLVDSGADTCVTSIAAANQVLTRRGSHLGVAVQGLGSSTMQPRVADTSTYISQAGRFAPCPRSPWFGSGLRNQ